MCRCFDGLLAAGAIAIDTTRQLEGGGKPADGPPGPLPRSKTDAVGEAAD
ncbi:hypothetical protein GCM10010191_21620 [Actinomadura vinacea]|uniref:Uncharacterized protein n=1 Tax=Actinomadura vinacea TaxID=115336 RepID=A0ABP5VU87_9ACTN